MSESFSNIELQAGEPPQPPAPDSGIIISEDTRRANRLPPRQWRTRKWPVLDAFGPPQIDLETWSLDIYGLVDRPMSFSLEEFRSLPRVKIFADMHCVTRWSRLGNVWEGVSVRHLLELAGIKPEAKFAICHAYDNGWTTNLPLADFLAPDALLTDTHDGRPISIEHGGPVRGMVPQRYAWKSAKWIHAIQLTSIDHPGYWEQGGYHLRGDPWKEERFRNS